MPRTSMAGPRAVARSRARRRRPRGASTPRIPPPPQAARVRRPADPLLRHDRRDVAGGRDVEGGVPRADAGAGRWHAPRTTGPRRRALLDRDRCAVRAGEVDGRRRRGDVERDAVLLREHGERVRPDLVRHVAVGRDPVGADDDRLDLAAGEEVAAHPVGDQLDRDPVARELPRGQPRSLEERPGLGGEHPDRLSGLDGGADDTEGGAVARRSRARRRCSGSDRALAREQLRPVAADAPAGLEVLGGDRVGLRDQGVLDRLRRPGGAPLEAPLHALERGEEVDRRRPRRGEHRRAVAKRSAGGVEAPLRIEKAAP